MLKAPCSSQLKVWQKGVAFKTFLLWHRLCNIPWLPFTICTGKKRKYENWNVPNSYLKQSLRSVPVPASEKQKVPNIFLPGTCASSRQDRVLLNISWYISQFSLWHSGLRVHLEALPTTEGFADRHSPSQVPGELCGVWRLNKASWPKNWPKRCPQSLGRPSCPLHVAAYPQPLCMLAPIRCMNMISGQRLYLKSIPVNNSFFRILPIPNM